MRWNRIAVICALSILLFSRSLSAWEIKSDNKLGGMSIHQEADDRNGDWVGFFYEGLLSIGHDAEEGFIGNAEVGFPVSATSEEQWTNRGIEAQTNDLNYWGINTNFEIGYAFPTTLIGDLEIGVAPLVGYGFSFLKFERSGFDITTAMPGVAVVSEDYNYHHLDIGGKIYWFASDRITVNLKSMVGFIVYNSNYNSQLGDLTGGNGFLVKTNAGIDYIISRNLIFNLDGFIEFHRLHGATSGNFTWLDTDLTTYGGKLGMKYIF